MKRPIQQVYATDESINQSNNTVTLPEAKKAKSNITDSSSWMNSVVLLNIYSFLPFRDVLTFRLVGQSMSEALHISASSTDELFFMNRIAKMKHDLKDKSNIFFHGCLMKVTAEIRNCMVEYDYEAPDSCYESDDNFILLCTTEAYTDLFKSGTVSFNSFIGGVFSQTQGGHCELKILKKSAGKEYMTFAQHYIYGPNTRVDNLERSYHLNVRDSNNEVKVLIGYLNSYYTWEDEPTGQGKIDIKAIKETMKKLDIPSEWDWKDFLKFLMVSAGAKEYCCADPIINENGDVMKSMIKELRSGDGQFETISPEHADIKEGLEYLDKLLLPITQSNLSYSQKLEQFEIIRSQILKESGKNSKSLYSFDSENNWDNYDNSINESMFKQLKSKLRYFNIHEAAYIGFTEYIQEERIFASAVFELVAGNSLAEIAFEYHTLYTFTDPSEEIFLTMNNEVVGVYELIEPILGIDIEQLEEGKKEVVIRDFSKCLLKIFGRCHRTNITESTAMTIKEEFYPHSLKDAVALLEQTE